MPRPQTKHYGASERDGGKGKIRWGYILIERKKNVGIALSKRLAWAWKRVNMREREFEPVELLRFDKYPQFQNHPAKEKKE